MNFDEKTVSKKHVFSGGIIDVEQLTVTLPNGKQATRDVVIHPGAAVVIPISSDNHIYMVKQFRKPIEKVLLEVPAGKLDPGEDPMKCACRELKEETGLESANVKHLISIHTTPGFSNEVIHIYVATELTEGESCADEDEFISSEKVHIDELVKMVLNHEITDAKSIIGILMADKIVKGELKL